VYTHYTGVFVVAFQFLWALVAYRDRLRMVVFAAIGTALLFAPWLPGFLEQRADSTAVRLETYALTFETFWRTIVTVLVGHPVTGLDTVPGVGLWAIVIGCAGAAAIAVARCSQAREFPIRRDHVLLAGLALASPVGALVYSLGPENVYGARYLSASVPAAAVLVGGLLASPRRPAAVAAVTAIFFGGLVLGTWRTLGAETQRSPFDEIARELDEEAPPRAPVVEVSIWNGAPSRQLGFYFIRDHQYFINGQPVDGAFDFGRQAGAFYVVTPTTGIRFVDAFLMQDQGFRKVARTDYAGAPPLTVLKYVPSRRASS
jgi:hypothetical protein